MNYQKNLSAVSSNVEEMFYSSVQSAYMISENNLINNILVEDSSSMEIFQINNVREVLAKYKIIQGDFINSILIFDWERNLVITDESIYDMDLYFNEIAYSKDYNMEFYLNNKETTRRHFDILKPTVTENKIDKSERKIIPIVFYTNTKYSFENLLVMNIDTEFLQLFLSEHSLSEDSNLIMYDPTGGVYSSVHSCDESINQYIELYENNSIVQYNDKIVIYSKNEHSMFKNFRYIAIIPESDIEAKLLPMTRVFYLSAFVCLFVLLIISLLMTKSLYHQIKRLMTIIPDNSKTLYGRNKNEFELIEDNIKKIIYNNTIINAQLSAATLIARESLFSKILFVKEHNLNQEELIKEFEKCGVVFKNNYFLISVIKFSYSNNFIKSFDNEESKRFYDSLMPLLSSFISSDIDLYTIEIENSQFCLVFNIPHRDYLPKIKRIIESFYESFNIDGEFVSVLCGIGNVKEGIGNVHYSYSEAMSAFSRCNVYSGENIQIYKSEKTKPIVDITSNEENKIYNYLISGKIEETESLLSKIKNRVIALNCNNDEISTLYFKLYMIAQAVLKAKNIDENEIISKPKQNDIKEMSLNELDEFISLIYKDIVVHFASNGRKSLICDVLNYISEHYDENLYLDSIAKKFGISSRYLSRAFKAYTNVGFVDYMNELRVSKAIELLVNSDYTVASIAKKVGFNSRNTFYRVFKNSQGITPTEYRQKYYKK